jgi:predicted RNase H-like HicB family nuclease
MPDEAGMAYVQENTMTLHIRIVSDRGGYMAACPSLPGCMTRGSTREEARTKIGEAIVGYLAAVNNFVPDNLPHKVVEV